MTGSDWERLPSPWKACQQVTGTECHRWLLDLDAPLPSHLCYAVLRGSTLGYAVHSRPESGWTYPGDWHRVWPLPLGVDAIRVWEREAWDDLAAGEPLEVPLPEDDLPEDDAQRARDPRYSPWWTTRLAARVGYSQRRGLRPDPVLPGVPDAWAGLIAEHHADGATVTFIGLADRTATSWTFRAPLVIVSSANGKTPKRVRRWVDRVETWYRRSWLDKPVDTRGRHRKYELGEVTAAHTRAVAALRAAGRALCTDIELASYMEQELGDKFTRSTLYDYRQRVDLPRP